MNKWIKYTLIALALIILALVIMGLTGPKSFHINRSVVISSDINNVWPYVSSAQKMQEWSPWATKDSTLQIEYFGEEGMVGSGYSWNGKELGEGKQTITMLAEPNRVIADLKIRMPFGDQMSTVSFDLKDTLLATRVNWGMRGDNNFFGRIFSQMYNLDEAIGKDYEEGLANLKRIVEAETDTVIYQINTGQFPGGQYLGIRGTIPLDEVIPFYDFNLQNLLRLIQFEGQTLSGAPLAMFYNYSIEKGTVEMVVCINYTKAIENLPEEVEIISLPSSYYVTTDYYGGHHGIRKAHVAVNAFLKDNKANVVPPFLEVYMTDGQNEPDSNKYLTKVVYFVK